MEKQLMQQNGNGPFNETSTYQIKNKIFIVEPVFPKDGKETLGAVLMRLIKTDMMSR